MSDIIYSFRPNHVEDINRAKDIMKYYDSIIVKTFHFKYSSFALSRADDIEMWGPYLEKGVFVALNGRIALDTEVWSKIKANPNGGIACNYIYSKYIECGESCISELNGNFTVFIYDSFNDNLVIGTDRCGAVPCFRTTINNEQLIIGSHPDIIAALLGKNVEIDLVSCAEFISTGKLSPPHTYYKSIKFLESASVHKITGNYSNRNEISRKCYFTFPYSFEHKLKENELIETLSFAFKKAVNKRTQSIFGKTGVSLSAGLDSRTILCSINNKDEITTFSFFDEENNELSIAKKIASSANVPFIPIRRKFDHYGAFAVDGIRISAGMSDFGNNHYLGFKDILTQHGIANILSGFYCDYLFKGLALNKRESKFTRREKLAPFDFSWYMPIYKLKSKYDSNVQSRLESLFPEPIVTCDNNLSRSIIEKRRIFPLCYEPDNIESIVPQRTMGWYLPIVDNDILDIYLKIPPHLKLNINLFSKVTCNICGNVISKIANGNTGARVDAHPIEIMFASNIQAIKRKIVLMGDSIATFDSWPNWDYYIRNSLIINKLWYGNIETFEFIREICGDNFLKWKPKDFAINNKIRLFRRILTLKIWLENNLSKSALCKL